MSEAFPGSAEVTSSLTELTALLLMAEDVETALQHLARLAVTVVPDGPSCGITIIRDGNPVTAVYAGHIPASVHEAQYATGDGPGLEAMRTRAPVVVQNLAAERRWPGFRAAALAAGARGVYAQPLQAQDELLGALTLYAHEPGLFPESTQRVAVQLVEPATLLLRGLLHRLSQEEVIVALHQRLASRAVIDQAIGIIMARYRCDPEQALARLRKMSNDQNTKLRDVAASLVDSVGGGPPYARGR